MGYDFWVRAVAAGYGYYIGGFGGAIAIPVGITLAERADEYVKAIFNSQHAATIGLACASSILHFYHVIYLQKAHDEHCLTDYSLTCRVMEGAGIISLACMSIGGAKLMIYVIQQITDQAQFNRGLKQIEAMKAIENMRIPVPALPAPIQLPTLPAPIQPQRQARGCILV